MPGGRPPIPHAIREAVLARIARGERAKAVCAEPGMPHQTTLNDLARRDPCFAARYQAARAQGEHLRTCRYDEAQAAELLRRLGEGEHLRSVLADPAMPSRRTYRIWRQDQAPFAEAVFAINREKARTRAAKRAIATHRPYDARIADRVLVRVGEGHRLRTLHQLDPALPNHKVIARWRRQDPDFAEGLAVCLAVARKRRARARLCNPATIERITHRLMQGETLAAIGRRRDMPSATTLYAWLRTRPEFYAAVKAALRTRGDMLADDVLDLAEDRDRPPGSWRAYQRLKRQVERLDAKAAKAGPDHRWRRSKEPPPSLG